MLPRVHRHRRLACVLAVLALVAAGCNGDAEPEPTTPPSQTIGPVSQAEADATVEGLCEMIGLGRGERDAVNAIFYDESHAGIHRIAADVETDDRAAAALLLERKLLVEQDLLAEPISESFRSDVHDLVDAISAAVKVLGFRAPDCSG
ncbi:MAG: hypothetical protein WEA54_04440 [Actinomycetota bacterium]